MRNLVMVGMMMLGLGGCSSKTPIVVDGPVAFDAAVVIDGAVVFDAARTVDAAAAFDATLDAHVALPDAPSACVQARTAWQTRFAMLDDTCGDANDCALAGSPYPECNGVISVGHNCEGDAARASAIAAAASDLQTLQEDFEAACGDGCHSPDIPCTFDCGPGHAECLLGHCVTRPNPCPDNCLCFDTPDAGP